MEKYLYNADDNNFYPLSLKDSYVAAGVWPEKGVEVDEDVFSEFVQNIPTKVRQADKNGYPEWVERPPVNGEESVAINENLKKIKINEATEYINTNQWPGKVALGRLTNSEKNQYTKWIDYVDLLLKVDPNNPDWPEKPV